MKIGWRDSELWSSPIVEARGLYNSLYYRTSRNIYTLKFMKEPPFWVSILTWQFFATENCFNMVVLLYILPLIVILVP